MDTIPQPAVDPAVQPVETIQQQPPVPVDGGGDFFSGVPTLLWVFLALGVSLFVFFWWQKRMSGPQRPGGGSSGGGGWGGGSRGRLDDQFTRSSARREEPTTANKKTFADVAGCDEGIKKLKRVVRWLKSPGRFKKMGARVPKGILLVGPPGTGKTLLAKATAGESDSGFMSMSGSQFVEVYVGVGAARVRDLFSQARNEVQQTGKSVIIFIDELDAVGKQRSSGGPGSGGNDEREQTLNQILVEMDGFSPNEGILVLAATNRVDILDPALRRPGRFDYQILIDNPDKPGREAIFKIHMRGKPVADNVDAGILAGRTPGLSGAEIESVCNEAATLAAERVEQIANKAAIAKLVADGKSQEEAQKIVEETGADEIEVDASVRGITLHEFDEAIDIVQMGEARVSRAHAMTKEDMRQTAYHEAGHAAVVTVLKGDPVTKITIVPRARALGYVQSLPEHDRFNMTVEQLKTRMKMAMAGRVAQEVFLNTSDTGASNDFQQATRISRRMVTEFGMSSIGPICVEDHEGYPDAIGPELRDKIDAEWVKLNNECMDEARRIIQENREKIERVVAILLEKETLLGHEFRAIWNDDKPAAIGTVNGAAPAVAESLACNVGEPCKPEGEAGKQ